MPHIPSIGQFMTSTNGLNQGYSNAITAIAARTFKAAIDSGKQNDTDGKLSQKEMKQSEITKHGVLKVEEKGENYQKMEKLTRRKQSLVNFSFYRGNQPGPLLSPKLCHGFMAMSHRATLTVQNHY
jgi:hypothetical protein